MQSGVRTEQVKTCNKARVQQTAVSEIVAGQYKIILSYIITILLLSDNQQSKL